MFVSTGALSGAVRLNEIAYVNTITQAENGETLHGNHITPESWATILGGSLFNNASTKPNMFPDWDTKSRTEKNIIDGDLENRLGQTKPNMFPKIDDRSSKNHIGSSHLNTPTCPLESKIPYKNHFKKQSWTAAVGRGQMRHMSTMNTKMVPKSDTVSTTRSIDFRLELTAAPIKCKCKKELPFDVYPPLPTLKRSKKKAKNKEKKKKTLLSQIDVDKVTYKELFDVLLKPVYDAEAELAGGKVFSFRKFTEKLKKWQKTKYTDKLFADMYLNPAHEEEPVDKSQFFKHARVDAWVDPHDEDVDDEYYDPNNLRKEQPEIEDDMEELNVDTFTHTGPDALDPFKKSRRRS